jgi:glycine cleavage system H protein
MAAPPREAAMQVPAGLRYAGSHQWVSLEGDVATVGITDFAQDELGEIVYIQLSESGSALSQGSSMGEIESVKTVSDLLSPVSGEVLERNTQALDKPEIVNSDPYGEGWLVRVRTSDRSELEQLLSAEAYSELTAKQS